MIDVMLILLVFFMVTSTYLNLDMISVVATDQQTGGAATPDGPTPMLIHLTADGSPRTGGQTFDLSSLDTLVRARLAAEPLLSVIILPSGAATTQQLVSVMDTLARAGASRLRLIRLKPRPGATP